MESVLITGGSGLIGTRLSELLIENNYLVRHLSRSVNGNERFETFCWNPDKGYIDDNALVGINHVIHLAGAGIADKRWTDSRKKLILSSRTNGLKLIHDRLKNQNQTLQTLVSSSGINYYGFSDQDVVFTEESQVGSGFLPDVCSQWEQEAWAFQDLTTVSILRTSIVLAKEDGALKKLMQPIQWGFGAPLGSGKQWMPWIHIDDLCRLYMDCIAGKLVGVYNAVSEEQVNNEAFTKTVAEVIRKPLWLPAVPGFILKLFLGELADVLLKGNKASSQKARRDGFIFQYPKLKDALTNLLA